jgi:amino acid adenylation domain-containing protein
MSELRRLGVVLQVDGDNLICNAPKGVLTATMKAELASKKGELISFLQTATMEPANDRQFFAVDERDGNPPLSFAQERLWYLDQLEPNTATYNIPSAIRIYGALDVDTLVQALDEIVKRYEILRTCFAVDTDAPVQIVDPDMEIHLAQVDLSHLPDNVREDELAEYLQLQAVRPFDLSQAPLLRATCLRMGEAEHVLCFVAHHTIFDGTSVGLLLDELGQLYEAFAACEPSPLDATPVQYADYAIWQRKQLDDSEVARLLAYWRGLLGDNLPTLQMPTDRQRPARPSYRGSVETVNLSTDLVDRLTAVGRENGATQFMVLFAAFVALLQRYTAQDDLVVGTPVNARNCPELERAIGFYVNTLPIRVAVSGDSTFRDLVAHVRERCLGAFSHQELPFERLVQEFETERDQGRMPLFQSLFAFQDVTNRSFETAGLRWVPVGVDNQVSRTDLTFWVTRTADGVTARMEYSSDLFDAGTIARLLEHYGTLLAAIPDHHDSPISELPIMSDRERRKLLVDWNATQTSYPDRHRLHELIEARADVTPDATAVEFENRTATYGELNRQANRLAHHLLAQEVGPEDLVGVCLDRSIDMLVALLAVLKSGAAYVPLDPEFPQERLAYMMADADIPMLLTSKRLSRQLPETDAIKIILDDEQSGVARHAESNPETHGGPDDLAYVIYTSGSTGKPKGVQVPHRGVVNFLCSMRRKPGFSESDRLLAVTTLSFDIAVLELFLPLTVGGSVVIASRDVASDGRKLLDTLSAARITVMQATPATWRLLVAAGWDDSLPLKVLCGGEPMPTDLAEDLLARSRSVWNLYGPTETTIWSTCFELTEPGQPIRIGHPIDNTEVYVLDGTQRPVPPGVPGELYIGGVGVTRGYLKRPELTADRFLPDTIKGGSRQLYRTGDLARWCADGTLEHLGRVDSQVKVRGFRIELGEIESVLNEHNTVGRTAVNVWQPDADDHRLVAYIVLNGTDQIDTIGLRKHLSSRLPAYMLPQHYVAVDDIPLTPNGKMDRKRLPAPTVSTKQHTTELPETDAERTVAGIWAELLGIDRVGRHDNFFDLGGHSLLAVKAVIEIEKASGTRIDLRSILLEDLSQIAERTATPTSRVPYERAVGKNSFFRKLMRWPRRNDSET